MNNYLPTRFVVGAAIVGLVGAAGVFIYEQVYAEKRRAMLVREVARLDKQVTTMRTELENLRELQKESNLRRAKLKKKVQKKVKDLERGEPAGVVDTVDAPEHSYASDSEYCTDYQSLVGTDCEMDDEFYDVHTDESDDTLRDSVTNGHAHAHLDEDLSEKTDDAKPLKPST